MKRPNLLLYSFFGFILVIFAYFKGQRIKKNDAIKGPAIVIANHTSFYDFIYSTTAIFPKRLSYVAVDKMFYMQPSRFLFKLFRAIPKCLFQPDYRSTRSIFEILNQKGIVCLYPEGQISPIGKTQDPPYQIAKLIKKAQVNLYACKHQGAYFSNPPWSKKSFRGKVLTEVDLVLSKHDILSMSLDDIYDHIKKSIAYNASIDNTLKRWPYNINDISNFESVLYQCPTCHKDSLTPFKTSLICKACNSSYTLDKYGLINGKPIDSFYQQQIDYLKKHILNTPDFRLNAKVELESYHKKKLKAVGSGYLTLDLNAYTYQGTYLGEPRTLSFDPKHIPTLPSDLGKNIQIYHDYLIYQFKFINPNELPSKFVIAGELIHQIKHGN